MTLSPELDRSLERFTAAMNAVAEVCGPLLAAMARMHGDPVSTPRSVNRLAFRV